MSARRAVGDIMNMETFTPCHCCTYEQDGTCVADANAVFEIPTDIMHVGCGNGFYDDIPF